MNHLFLAILLMLYYLSADEEITRLFIFSPIGRRTVINTPIFFGYFLSLVRVFGWKIDDIFLSIPTNALSGMLQPNLSQ